MSAPNQTNGKKSSNSSVANTPASTPVTNTNGNTQSVINSPPPNNNAPKYGTLVPNRIFVGGISANTTEGELLQLFSSYGTVKAAKIIQDRAGVSKGYGFITFESEDDAKRPLREAENIVLRERKLNIAPAIKKQPFNRAFDGASPPTVTVGNPTPYFLPATAVPYFQGNVGYYAPPNGPNPGDPNSQQAAVYQPPPVYPTQTGPPQGATYPSMIYPQTIYMPQQYPMPMPYEYNYYTNNGGPPQYMVGAQGGPGPQGPPLPPSGSPPRPPCYNQQIPYPAEPVFYNVPMFGAPMEHPPVYADALETGNNLYNEQYELIIAMQGMSVSQQETYHTPSSYIPQEFLESRHPPQLSSPESDLRQTYNNTPTPPHLSEPTVDIHQRFVGQRIITQQQQQLDTTRQTHTPVVSLLSIEQSQERDYSSMTGGRKKKAPPGPTQQASQPSNTSFHHHNHPPNGYNSTTFHRHTSINAYANHMNYSHHHQQTTTQHHSNLVDFMSVPTTSTNLNGPVPPTYNLHQHDYRHYNKPAHHSHQKQQSTTMNGYVNNNRNKPRRVYNNNNYNSINNDFSNRSSLRTDSNSSASVVDENRNEDKYRTTNVTTPPPAPYSPLNNHGYTLRYEKRGAPTAPAPSRGGRGPTAVVTVPFHRILKPDCADVAAPSNVNNANDTNSDNGISTTDVIINHDLTASQVHAGNQSYAPPAAARRSRRSIRRGGNPSGGLSEIGAGDAPLPNAATAADVAEACKKLDGLKL